MAARTRYYQIRVDHYDQRLIPARIELQRLVQRQEQRSSIPDPNDDGSDIEDAKVAVGLAQEPPESSGEEDNELNEGFSFDFEENPAIDPGYNSAEDGEEADAGAVDGVGEAPA